MSFLSGLFGRKSATAAVATGDLKHPLPLGLRIGGCVAFDRTMYRVAPGAMTDELPDGHQTIACYGHIDLGDGYAMHRFYVEDDAYLQVLACGESIESIKAFVFHDTVNPPTKQAFQDFVAAHPHLGAQQIDYAGRQWSRLTSADAGAQRIPPMAFDEVLYRQVPPRRDDDLTHYAMVYRRDVPELGREELLVVTGEDSGPNEFCVTYAVGIDLTQADIDIT